MTCSDENIESRKLRIGRRKSFKYLESILTRDITAHERSGQGRKQTELLLVVETNKVLRLKHIFVQIRDMESKKDRQKPSG